MEEAQFVLRVLCKKPVHPSAVLCNTQPNTGSMLDLSVWCSSIVSGSGSYLNSSGAFICTLAIQFNFWKVIIKIINDWGGTSNKKRKNKQNKQKYAYY